MIAEALRNLIIASPSIVSSLATYEFTTGVPTPAVFTTDVIPDDAGYPSVIINEGGGTLFGTRAQKGASQGVNIRIYGDKNRNTTVLRALAWSIWSLVHRSSLTITGFTPAITIADPPSALSDPDNFPGYIISVRTTVLEN